MLELLWINFFRAPRNDIIASKSWYRKGPLCLSTLSGVRDPSSFVCLDQRWWRDYWIFRKETGKFHIYIKYINYNSVLQVLISLTNKYKRKGMYLQYLTY